MKGQLGELRPKLILSDRMDGEFEELGSRFDKINSKFGNRIDRLVYFTPGWPCVKGRVRILHEWGSSHCVGR